MVRPPLICVFSWDGQVIQTLGQEQLSLRTNVACFAVSPVHEGRFSVCIRSPAGEEDQVHTYRVSFATA